MMLVRSTVLAWVLFLVLGATMWFLRYYAGAPAQYAMMLKDYGPYIVIVLHVVIVLTAFQDTVFQGILCLLIPFYSFYYLFLVSDSFYLRAVGAGLLVGVGVDSASFFQAHVGKWVDAVSGWIASGGGSSRDAL
jgi:hypothetical protein